MGVIFWGTFSEKRAFYLFAPSKQILFLTISNENIFEKTLGTRLGATVAPNKGLEQALVSLSSFNSIFVQISKKRDLSNRQ